MLKLIAFDLDGTLIDRDSEIILPGVLEYFMQLPKPCPINFAVLSNQGGVGYGDYREVQGKARGDFPTLQQADAHIYTAVDGIHRHVGQNLIRFCAMALRFRSRDGKWLGDMPEFRHVAGSESEAFHRIAWSRLYRKPNPGMLWMAMMLFDALPEETLYIGDSQEDLEAAIAAGTNYEWANKFFGRVPFEI